MVAPEMFYHPSLPTCVGCGHSIALHPTQRQRDQAADLGLPGTMVCEGTMDCRCASYDPATPSKGHVAWLVSETGHAREALLTPKGELYLAPAHNVLDQHGYRAGRFEAPKWQVGQALALLRDTYGVGYFTNGDPDNLPLTYAAEHMLVEALGLNVVRPEQAVLVRRLARALMHHDGSTNDLGQTGEAIAYIKDGIAQQQLHGSEGIQLRLNDALCAYQHLGHDPVADFGCLPPCTEPGELPGLAATAGGLQAGDLEAPDL